MKVFFLRLSAKANELHHYPAQKEIMDGSKRNLTGCREI
jgi:hypothetical protein